MNYFQQVVVAIIVGSTAVQVMWLTILSCFVATQTREVNAMAWYHRRRLPPADVRRLKSAIRKLQALTPQKGVSMSSPSDLVSISQAELTTFATEISAAVAVLQPYIAKLVAGQTVQLAAADESAVKAAVASLQGLEPPAPAV
jgi:hypothetical protein